MILQTFAPQPNSGQLANAIVIATSGSAASATLRTLSFSNKYQVLVNNAASAWLYLNFGNASLTAAAVPTSTNIPITAVPPNAAATFTIGPDVTTVSAILATGSGVAIINVGEGI